MGLDGKYEFIDPECKLPVTSSTHWGYMDYKHFETLFSSGSPAGENLVKSVDFSKFWPTRKGNSSRPTLWLGSAMSCTPLHYDSYGVNLVAQLQGEKKWILYAPEESTNLYPTRVPFENSSVYASVDPAHPQYFRYPRFRDAQALTVTLRPGDLLYVPKHWWHYVVAETTSLSVNSWFDVPGDEGDRLRELVALVLMNSYQTYAGRNRTEVARAWLNPTDSPVDHKTSVALCARLLGMPLNSPSSHSLIDKALLDCFMDPEILEVAGRKLRQHVEERSRSFQDEVSPERSQYGLTGASRLKF